MNMFDPNALGFYWNILKQSVSKFLEDDVFTHAAALSYYTIFSLPPMLLIIFFTAAQFYSEATIEAAIFDEIGNLVGQESANQLANTLDKLNIYDTTWWATILGIAILVFTATTVFVTMQNALNKVFKVKAKPKGIGIFKLLKDRVLSFTFLIGIAFVMLVSLTVNAVITAFTGYLENWLGEISAILTIIASIVLPFVIITSLFALIFKFLPDAKIQWRDTWAGAFFTTFLFAIGKYLIGYYIGNSDTANLYDTAGSVMVIMLWVFYASAIFLFGAVFTYVRADVLSEGVQPADYAVRIVQKEVELEKVK